MDDSQLRAFFDTLIPRQLADHHIPGAVVAVVAEGQIVYAQGYGYADVDRQIPVVAERTLVNIGSCGKLFTWTAVMHLVEQGKLDLHADVATYLDFRIPATYPAPITLTHLLTHTAGFENRDLGLVVPRLDAVPPLGAWLATHVPARVRPPGVEAGYSNYGAALAGYIVARVAGVPYPRYLDEHILRPLGMQRTTPDQRLPPDLASDLAHGYLFRKGTFVERPFDVFAFAAIAGGNYATPTDMAHFMIAHLRNGRYGAARILQEQTARQMHRTLFRVDLRLNGMAYGFMPRRAVCRRPGASFWCTWSYASPVPCVKPASPFPHALPLSAVRASGLRPPDGDHAKVVLSTSPKEWHRNHAASGRETG